MGSADCPSIHDLEPRERGGEEARRGFLFQDHVAAGFYIEVLEGARIQRVWCEAEDDITVVWESEGGQLDVEFIQVKSDEHDQLWSAALICEGSTGNADHDGGSILEKSLARDRYKEAARFRLVTARDINRDLKHLALPLTHSGRAAGSEAQSRLAGKITAKAKEFRSRGGNDWTYWVVQVLWDVRHSQPDLERANLARLEPLIRALEAYLAPDQRRHIYQRLVSRAVVAATARRIRDGDKKCVQPDELRRLLQDATKEMQNAGIPDSESTLEARLRGAGLDDTAIRQARERRLQYARQARSQPYYVSASNATLDEEVAARLHMLWSRFDAGLLADSPSQFHVRCLEALEALREELAPSRPPLSLLQGMMYDLVARCLHRFDRAVT